MNVDEDNKSDKELNEPSVGYNRKEIMVFYSAEEQADYERKIMASLTHEELLSKLEAMRKFFLRDYLLPNGEWPPLSKKIRILTPFVK